MVSPKIVMLLVGAFGFTAFGKEFLKQDAVSIQAKLDDVLDEVLGQGHGVADARLTKIRNALDAMFRSSPKNKLGHISAPVMRYTVRRYFSQNHAWIVKGFEPSAQAVKVNALDNGILQANLSMYVRSIFEDRFAHEGFSLDALVAMVASIERLAFDDVVRGVKLGYHLNKIPRTKALTSDNVTEILSSFLITDMYHIEVSENKYKHMKDKKIMHTKYPHWNTTLLFLKDIVANEIFHHRASLNPFREPTHSFEDAARMAEQVTAEFGSWSNHECLEMKDMLTEMDVHHTGRVKLADFYQYSKNGAWQFKEPSAQLRHQGSLDESSSWLGPQVMIPNYITGESNCISSTPLYSICCLNECDLVFQHLEAHITGPTTNSSEIIRALESGNTTLDFNMTSLHRGRLDEMARLSGEKIALHGRLFAQWLHFAFPHQCPYPHTSEVLTHSYMSQKQWRHDASDKDISQFVESESGRRAPSREAGAKMWILEESLLVSSTPSDEHPIFGLLRAVAQISILVTMVPFVAWHLWEVLLSEKLPTGEVHI